MKRRQFITLIGGAAAWPLAARAQQPAGTRRVGMLINLSERDLEAQRLVKAFREGLIQLGWVDGRNLRMITAGQPVRSAASKPSQGNWSNCRPT